MKIIFWTGYSNDERITAISDIKKVVNGYGDITDFKLFSDISISVKIELKELDIDKLYDRLKKCLGLNNFDKLNSSSTIERVIFLNVTFIKGTGDKRIEVPAVAG